ncbi:MAG TPA: ATP-dependent protease ATPase subunit HslU [Polyangia bacterium]|jgi:ATP-dependent HslUV protease ATP-binding subunit HslU|nr:ATP-dependent protease ATPase subunit HslU [Polyangia bacterium]
MPVRDPRALTPRAIVEELDRYIVGQKAAKRAVAIALRNRWRRQQVAPELRDEIAPKNIIMIGPTGVGKTEIARRLAKLVSAPFLKIEASKFTEVGYVGRDVDSIVRDLVEISVKLVKDEEQAKVRARAREAAEEKLLDILLPKPVTPPGGGRPIQLPSSMDNPPADATTRDKLREMLRAGKLDDREVEVDVAEPQHGMFEVFSAPGMDQIGFDVGKLQSLFGGRGGGQHKRRKVKIPQAMDLLTGEEAGKLIDMDKVQTEAVWRAENHGIVFLDEIDKIAGSRAGGSGQGPDVSREGVQRDLLPIVEGSSVTTKYGVVKTDHVLFIAAGAFHVAKPSDLIPELQGRFPIRVELEALGNDDFVRILTEPENSLTRQYQALLATEGVRIEWKPDAIQEIARMATLANDRMENIGARRLHTIMERLLDELSFEAPGLGGTEVPITAGYVRERLSKVLEDEDLSKYIL